MNPLNNELLPRYSRVKRMITERIDSGEWRPRHRIPSESELVRDLGVSRMRVLSAPRQLLGIAAFGLEVTGYEE